MKARTAIIILTSCLLLASCNHNKARHDDNNKTAPIGTTSNLKSAEQIAHEHGCMTIKELFDIGKGYTFFIEKSLPCSLYVSDYYLHDIVSIPPEPAIVFDPNIDINLYLDFDAYDKEHYSYDVYEGEAYYNFSKLSGRFFQKWSGKPSERQNECWFVGNIRQEQRYTDCIIGMDRERAECIADREHNYPIIVQVYQIKKNDDCFIVKGDLIEILKNE